MRFLSYNIHGCVGTDRTESPERVLEVIREIDADVVALQEVHSSDEQDRDFLKKLEALPYQSVIYGKTMRKPDADYGNLLLTRESTANTETNELPSAGGEPRGAIIADILLEGRSVRVINTHLGLKAPHRKTELCGIEKYLSKIDKKSTCVLIGDLNEWLPLRGYYRLLRSRFDHFSSVRTFPSSFPVFALDRIAVMGKIETIRFSVGQSPLARKASDHRPLICDIDW